MFDVSVLGLGYVGLPTAVLLAKSGLRVNGVDTNKHLISTLKNSKFNYDEPGLNSLIKEVMSNESLAVTEVPLQSRYFIICVPTPVDKDDNPDCSYVYSAIDSIIDLLEPKSTIILESTIPLGTTKNVASYIQSQKSHINWPVQLAHCPERVLPGNALNEIIYNNRIIGGTSPETTDNVAKLYRRFTQGQIQKTTSTIAEFAKLAENTFRDINIAYANELSMIAAAANVDINEVIRLANMHPRVHIHKPGIGVGGHCIPIDPWFLASEFPELAKIIKTARQVNILKESWIVDQILKSISTEVDKIVLLGLTYKENVDDFRESPAIRIATKLTERSKLDVISIDPFILEEQHYSTSHLSIGSYKDITPNSLVVLLVKHDSFQDLLVQLDKSKQKYLSF